MINSICRVVSAMAKALGTVIVSIVAIATIDNVNIPPSEQFPESHLMIRGKRLRFNLVRNLALSH